MRLRERVGMCRARAQTPRQEILQFVGGLRVVNGAPLRFRRDGPGVKGRQRVLERELPRTRCKRDLG
ncbi:MAG TPA: hypothetical protein VIX83_11380 [Candidatus Cybelea sp.]